MGPLLLSRMLELNEVQEGVLNIAFRVAADEKLPLINLDDLRAIINNVAERAKELTTKYGNVATTLGRRHPAPPAGARGAGRRPLLRRAGARHHGLHPHRARRPRRRQHPRRRQADGEAAALRDVPAVDADQAVADAARGRRPAQAQARVLLRRGASAVRRRAEGAAGAHRADRAPRPLEGRRRLLHHAEPDRRAEHGFGPARQPRAARAARLHAAGAEGGEGGGGNLPAAIPSSTPSA